MSTPEQFPMYSLEDVRRLALGAADLAGNPEPPATPRQFREANAAGASEDELGDILERITTGPNERALKRLEGVAFAIDRALAGSTVEALAPFSPSEADAQETASHHQIMHSILHAPNKGNLTPREHTQIIQAAGFALHNSPLDEQVHATLLPYHFKDQHEARADARRDISNAAALATGAILDRLGHADPFVRHIMGEALDTVQEDISREDMSEELRMLIRAQSHFAAGRANQSYSGFVQFGRGQQFAESPYAWLALQRVAQIAQVYEKYEIAVSARAQAANLLVGRGDYHTAMPFLKSVREQRGDPEDNLVLADAFRFTDDPDSAIAGYEYVLEMHSQDNPTIRIHAEHGKAAALHEAGRTDQAKATYAKLTAWASARGLSVPELLFE